MSLMQRRLRLAYLLQILACQLGIDPMLMKMRLDDR
jgi:hypothetical protein